MVQNSSRPRGRPRSYDREEALAAAMQTFWKAGYAGTSLDDLAQSMGMNRPSIYAAFGDKKALYLEAVDHYRRRTKANFDATFARGLPLCETLRTVATNAIERYVADAKGCFVISTTITEAAVDPMVRSLAGELIQEMEQAFTQRFQEAADLGVNLIAPPPVLGHMMTAVIHECALRARAGIPKAEIEAAAMRSIDMICGRP